MTKVISTSQALEAAQLTRNGFKLDHIVAMLGLTKRSRSAVWRAIRDVTTAEERIALYRRTGRSDVLSVGEAVAALSGDALPAAPDADKANE
jgi:hypothetical protein